MRKAEIVLVILFLIAVIMKFYLLPMSNVLVVLSAMLLAVIYFPFGLAFFNRVRLRHIFRSGTFSNIPASRVLWALFVGWTMSLLVAGSMFKMQQFPLTRLLLGTGLIAATAVIIVTIVRQKHTPDPLNKFIIKRILIAGLIGGLFFSISDLTITKIQFRDHPAYIEAYKEYLENRDDKEAEQKMRIEYRRATMPEDLFDYWMLQQSLREQ